MKIAHSTSWKLTRNLTAHVVTGEGVEEGAVANGRGRRRVGRDGGRDERQRNAVAVAAALLVGQRGIRLAGVGVAEGGAGGGGALRHGGRLRGGGAVGDGGGEGEAVVVHVDDAARVGHAERGAGRGVANERRTEEEVVGGVKFEEGGGLDGGEGACEEVARHVPASMHG